MISYGNIDLGQHRLRQWLVAWLHQATTWTNVDWSTVMSCGIHLKEISLLRISILNMHLKIANLFFQPHLQGCNELIKRIKESKLFQCEKVFWYCGWSSFSFYSAGNGLPFEMWSVFNSNVYRTKHQSTWRGYLVLTQIFIFLVLSMWVIISNSLSQPRRFS